MISGAVWLLRQAWHLISATTEPVLSGSAFSSEYRVMILIGLAAVAPLLGLAVIQAIARQDVGGLLRTALLRLPLALLLTAVVIELVSLSLQFSDQASVALLAAGGDPAAHAFGHIETALAPISPAIAGFGELLLVAVVGLLAFLLWVELAVRSAAVAVATLFLPLALSGLVWPATAHWARRLGETLAGLVLMKLVMAAVLALAGGALAATTGGVSSVVEGLALLALTAMAPFSLFRLIPMVESGAVGHLEGVRPAQQLKNRITGQASSSAQQIAELALGPGGSARTRGGSDRADSALAELIRSGNNVFVGPSLAKGGSNSAGASSGGLRPQSPPPPPPPAATGTSSSPGAPPPPPPTPPGRKGVDGWMRHIQNRPPRGS